MWYEKIWAAAYWVKCEQIVYLGFVLAMYEAHELTHTVSYKETECNYYYITEYRLCLTVVVGRSEGVFCHRPPRGEDDKVRDGHPCTVWLTGQHREYRGVNVVETDWVHHTELPQVVLVRCIIASPGQDVETRMVLLKKPKKYILFFSQKKWKGWTWVVWNKWPWNLQNTSKSIPVCCSK